MTDSKSQLKGTLILLTAALIWGSAFVAQEVGGGVGAFAMQGIRCLVGAAFLVPVTIVVDALKKKNGTYRKMTTDEVFDLVKYGIVCGAVMFIATNLQQLGINGGTEAGKAGFITAMYILFVPIIGIFQGKKSGWRLWVSVAAAIVGLYLLCVGDIGRIEQSDILVLACAVAFAAHITVIDMSVEHVDGVKLSCMQMFVSGVLSLIMMFIFEDVTIEGIVENAFPILYIGIASSGIAYTLQIVGQKYSDPVIGSLAMSMEAVFAVLSGILILHRVPSPREALGCAIMFAAIIFAQLPERRKITDNGGTNG